MSLGLAVKGVQVLKEVVDTEGEITPETIKRMQANFNLAASSGNIFKYLGKLVVNPTIFVSKDLEGTPSEVDAINAQLNVFVSTYVQAFQMMVGMDGVQATEAVTLLSTQKGELGRALSANAVRVAVEVARSECDLLTDVKRFLGYDNLKYVRGIMARQESERISVRGESDVQDLVSLNEASYRIKNAFTNSGKRYEDDIEQALVEYAPNGVAKDQLEEIVDMSYKSEADTDVIVSKIKQLDKNMGKDAKAIHDQLKRNSASLEQVKGLFNSKNKEEKKKAIKNMVDTSVSSERDKMLEAQLKSPTYNYFLRTFELNVNTSREGVGDASLSYQVKLPITVRANILYIDPDTLEDHLSINNRNSENGFIAQWNEFSAGSKSFWDLVTANTLVQNYRKNLKKDTKGLLEKIEQHNRNGQLKALTTLKAEGFEKYYNLFILSSNVMERLKPKIGSMDNDGKKDEFMTQILSQQLLVIDYDYELFQLYLLSIDGKSKGKLSSLAKPMGKDGSNDIMAALLANSVPRI